MLWGVCLSGCIFRSLIKTFDKAGAKNINGKPV
jgi:hypothetical protein